MSEPAAGSMPLVSILIPCFNADRWLRETLESALSQTWPRKEILVVDDGSRDNSLAIARGFVARGIRLIEQSNRGAASARNVALQASAGDWIQFLDADDLLVPDKIAQQLAGPLRDDEVITATWARFRQRPGDDKHIAQVLCADAAPVDWIVTKLEHNAMMHPAAWLTPRAVATKAGPWDESLTLDDDGEYFNRVVLASRHVRFCAAAHSYYRSGLRGSLSRAASERAWSSAARSLNLSVGRLLATDDSPRTRHACATAYQQFIFDSYPRAAAHRAAAAREVERLGGSGLVPPGGPRFQMASRLIGWQLATRLRKRQ